MTPFMDDDHIAAALSQPCCSCPARPGEECTDTDGKPLLESKGRPVHMRRLEP